MAGQGNRMICQVERYSKQITVKTSPRWCPLKHDAEQEG